MMLSRRGIISSGKLGGVSFSSFPVETDVLLMPFGAAKNTWIAGDLVNQRRASDNNQRVIGTDGAPDYLFDTADWSDHTSAGADPAYASTVYDQSGNGYDAVQSTADKQPLVLDDGTLVFDGINDHISSPITLTDGDNFTIITVIKAGSNLFDGANRTLFGFVGNPYEFWCFSTSSVLAFRNLAGTTNSFSKAVIDDGSYHSIIIRYDSSVGLKVDVDGTNVPVGGVAMTQTITPRSSNLFLGAVSASAGNADLNSRHLSVLNGVTLSDAQSLEVHNWILDRGALA